MPGGGGITPHPDLAEPDAQLGWVIRAGAIGRYSTGRTVTDPEVLGISAGPREHQRRYHLTAVLPFPHPATGNGQHAIGHPLFRVGTGLDDAVIPNIFSNVVFFSKKDWKSGTRCDIVTRMK